MTGIINEDAGLYAYLCAEDGGAVLDEAVRLYDLAGAARADKISEAVCPATVAVAVAVAVAHLLSTGRPAGHQPRRVQPEDAGKLVDQFEQVLSDPQRPSRSP